MFMLGVVHLPDPRAAGERLEELRSALLNDPYFAGVPSMSHATRKTALSFHAKDDVAEVRREVFKLLPTLGATVQVAIRRKSELVVEARALFRRGLKLRPQDVYDDMVRRLFKDLSSEEGFDHIVFARRGKAARLNALVRALSQKPPDEKIYGVEITFPKFPGAERVFEIASAIGGRADPPRSMVSAAFPHEFAGLQITDYYLWAVQRLFERGEDRFFKLLAPGYRLTMDLDDRRKAPEGEWYSAGNPLTLQKIMPVTS